MNSLIIDTTIKNGYAAVNNGNETFVEKFDDVSTMASLIPSVNKALTRANVATSDLGAVAAVIGPGSFTGIRIGVTFINAIADAINVPRYALTAFDVMLPLCKDSDMLAIDAGHDSAYTATIKGGFVTETANLQNAEVLPNTVFQSEVMDKLPFGASISLAQAIEVHENGACMPDKCTDYLKPFYMKKSQAERTLEEKCKM